MPKYLSIKYKFALRWPRVAICLNAGTMALCAMGDHAPAAPAASAAPESSATLPPAPTGTRFSASLRGEPLQKLLSLIENTTPVKFRYGAPVDTLVTETFDNAPLWPALEGLLLKSGFHMRRSRESVFLFRNEMPVASPIRAPRKPNRSHRSTPVPVAPAASAAIVPAAWQYWAMASAPPTDWMEVQTTPRASAVPSAGASPGWRNVELVIATGKSPGVAVTLPAKTTSRYLRWPMKLRDIPLGAQLLVETSAPATFYVNGALMFRRRSGRQVLDLSQVLRIGDNCLALQWEAQALSTPDSDSTAIAPALHYEWFFSERKPE